jgi:hypothetical protein
MCVAFVSLSMADFTCLHTPAQRQYNIIRNDVQIATFSFHRLVRTCFLDTLASQTVRMSAHSIHPMSVRLVHPITKGYHPHAGSAGFAGTCSVGN